MALPGFSLAYEVWEGNHHYSIFDVDADVALDLFAETVRQFYVEPDKLRDTLTGAMVGLDDIVDLRDIEALVNEVAEASIPRARQNPTRPHLDMARNETAEVLAHLVVERIHGSSVVASRIRNKEIPGQPTRGMDLLALARSDKQELSLVCSEVKASNAASSPPAVVEQGDDCLKNQLKKIISDHTRILQELNWAIKHADDQDKPMVAKAILLWGCHKLPLIVLPVLMRTKETGKETDFGTFRTNPRELAPAAIKFCIAKISIPIEEFANLVYTRAREAG
ncbi:Hachiman antiphage defense system protein HamA [Nonomuraea ferruginea]|uniref:SAVED domain-containing protein n=1 Tax=Nonomuraea ferruginea TaxID=46174 RepID=A0ABT4T095_9ACTN|nr:Hachiman antiphage defense system protein HamA [Nonomuraea ferruginea]MDA0642775.1 SAVED domain-containing protein [Nonomuraea ferruginea]